MTIDWTKLAGVLAIAFGAALLWVPPAALAHDAALSLAVASITGGFGALGVPILTSVAAARARAERDAVIRANRSAGAVRAARTRLTRRRGETTTEPEPADRP